MSVERFSNLVELPGFAFVVHTSPGVEAQARLVASRCESALEFLNPVLEFEPLVSLLVLGPEHWEEYASFPVYGMPHCSESHTVVVAGQGNELWQRRERYLTNSARAVYVAPDGTVNLSAFFNLLPVHELGHVYHDQAGRQFPRLWLMELFCNLCLHAYVAEVEPEELPALEALPRAVVDSVHNDVHFRSLAQFEQRYNELEPSAYGWYQFRLHVAAKRIWEAGGVEVLHCLWNACTQWDRGVSDVELAKRLREHVHPEVEHVLNDWPA